MTNKKLVVGNWKMNPATLAEAKKLSHKFKRAAPALANTEVVICPPLPFITACASRKKIAHFHMGAQTVSTQEEGGPHTGEVGAHMLRDIGVEYVIVGHSEQRKRGDTNETVAARLKAVLGQGLTPILCIGESVRDESGAYLGFLKDQIKASCGDILKKSAKSIIVAYEPIWAIGAAEAMKPEDVYETSLFIKKVFADLYGADMGLKVTVLYGGSVTYRNAPDIITIGKVDGLLVGRESVNIPGFVELIKEVDRVSI
ncbi:MAG: triose-phosphate isomerase [Candidatus Taylorbacteria bacterium]